VIADLQKQVAALTREVKEAREQQTATSEVLQVISSSSGELAPVFESLLASAKHLCGAEFGAIFLREGDAFRIVALHAAVAAYTEARWRAPFIRPAADTGLGRVLETKQVVQIADVRAVAGYVNNPVQAPVVQLAGVRSKLSVPMLKEEDLIGVIEIDRQEVRPFTDKQIELVKNFAAQAVIAIENARLLNELRQRTNDLTASLQQQTATADVLKVISGSPGTLDPVFSTMLAKATELCEASYGTLWLHEGDGYRAVAMHGDLPPVWIEQWRSGAIYRPGPDRPIARAAEGRRPIQIADMRTDPSYLQGDRLPVAGVEIAGIRTLLLVPMFKESEHVGLIAIYRTEVLPFTEKQIDLVKNFAAQAVIAIENTRLLNELRQRTGDLSESLEQQTATSEVLRVISSSPGELEPVFNTMLTNAVRICEAKFGTMLRAEEGGYRVVAMHGPPPAYAAERRRNPVLLVGPTNPLARVAASRQLLHIADVRLDQAYLDRDPAFLVLADDAGARTLLMVPMLKEDKLIGAIAIYRQEVRPFTEKQVELVKNFAAQAVIAIENARLLNELRQRTDDLSEALEQQTATSEVLKVISGSPSELKPVFDAILENATRICEAKFGTLWLREGDAFRVVALHNAPPAYEERRRSRLIPLVDLHPKSAFGRFLKTRQVTHIADKKPW
jgi:GAF domain-containing protein